ncbi:MAG: biotin--[acetyl-CoA-carboxylase] ligase [Cyanobacteria bacterium P01_A01_bin.84]
MTLNRQQLESFLKLERNSVYFPFSLHIFDTLSSTNKTAWELSEQNVSPGCVVIATKQTAGRGQWGRVWNSAEGGLYISVLITTELAAKDSYQLTLASAWGIADKLQQRGIRVEIKWPNDLVLDGFKLGGILTETKIQQEKIQKAVIGVGINWQNPVPATGINLTTWQRETQCQAISSLEHLAATVLLGIESGIQCLSQEGVNILLSRYIQLLRNLGDEVYLNHQTGTVVGVTTGGNLHVRMKTSDSKSVTTPEIYFQPGTIKLGYRKNP